MQANQLREYIIRPVIQDMGVGGEAAENLLLMTIAAESGGGHYLHQVGGGPAVGIYQMEPNTHDDIWENYLAYRESMAGRVGRWRLNDSVVKGAQEMAGNLYYATAMARAHYLRFSEPIPDADDVEALAHYHKQFYNTDAGAAHPERTVKLYREFVG